MTEYYKEQQRIERLRQRKKDTPISISDEKFTKSDKPSYYCSYCQCNLIKLSDDEWYCNRCSISQFPAQEEMRKKSKISTPMGLHMESLVAYPPEPNDLSKPEVEIKGGLKALKDRGIKITSYKEDYG